MLIDSMLKRHSGINAVPASNVRGLLSCSRRCSRREGRQQLHVICAAAPTTAVEQVSTNQATASLNGAQDVCVPQFPAPSPGHFTADRTSFLEEHRIRGYEVRPDQRATIVTIANLLQEIAGNHAVGMWGRAEDGFAKLPSTDVIFVMTRLQIRMHEYPKWGDIVSIETYFTEEGRLAARRDWVITNTATGQILGGATSTWVTINLATRRLAKLPDDLKSKFLRLSPRQPRHAIPVDETKKKLEDFPEENFLMGPQQMARRSDMDMNGHINNVTYLAWALEGVPEDTFVNKQLYEVEIDFKAECLAGEQVASLCSVQQPATEAGEGDGNKARILHSIRRVNGSNGAKSQELVRCRTTWIA